MDSEEPSMSCGPDGSLRQCDGFFTVSAAVVGQATNTFTFNPANSNYETFRPRRLLANAYEDDTTSNLNRLITHSITSIQYSGIEWLGGGNVPLIAFGAESQNNDSPIMLPRLLVSGRNLVFTVSSDQANSVTTLVTLSLRGRGTRAGF
jgi:hypothetical protein